MAQSSIRAVIVPRSRIDRIAERHERRSASLAGEGEQLASASPESSTPGRHDTKLTTKGRSVRETARAAAQASRAAGEVVAQERPPHHVADAPLEEHVLQ